MVKDPVFELECELNNEMITEWQQKYKRNKRKMAKSFIYKIADIMLASGIHFQRIY